MCFVLGVATSFNGNSEEAKQVWNSVTGTNWYKKQTLRRASAISSATISAIAISTVSICKSRTTKQYITCVPTTIIRRHAQQQTTIYRCGLLHAIVTGSSLLMYVETCNPSRCVPYFTSFLTVPLTSGSAFWHIQQLCCI